MLRFLFFFFWWVERWRSEVGFSGLWSFGLAVSNLEALDLLVGFQGLRFWLILGSQGSQVKLEGSLRLTHAQLPKP